MRVTQRNRRVFFYCLIVGLLVLLALVLVPALIDINRFRPEVEERMTRQLGRRVQVQNLRLALLGGIRITAGGLTISENSSTGSPDLLRAETMTLAFSWMALARGSKDPSSVLIERAHIRLREISGQWNFLPPKSVQQEGSQPAATTDPTTAPMPSSVRIRHSTLDVESPHLPGPLETQLELDIEPGSARPGETSLSGSLALDRLRRKSETAASTGLSVRTRFDATVAVAAGTLDLRRFELETGSTRLSAVGRIEDLSAEARGRLRVSMPEALPADLMRLASLVRGGTEPQETRGTVSVDLTLSGALANPEIEGSLDSQELIFVYPDIKEPVKISRIHAELKGTEIQTNEFQARVGTQTTVVLSARITNLGQDPNINFDARTTAASPLQELLRIGSSLGAHLPAELKVESGSAAFDLSGRNLRLKSRRFDVSGTVKLYDARVRLAHVERALTLARLELRLGAGQVRSNQFEIAMDDGGSLGAEFELRDTPQGPDLQASIKTKEPLAADRWLAAGQALGVAPPAGMKLTGGRISLDLEVRSRPGETPSARGTLQFREGALTSRLSREPLYVINAFAEVAPQRVNFRDVEAKFLESTFRAAGSVALDSVPRLSLNLQGSYVDLEQLRAAFTPSTTPAPSSSPDPFPPAPAAPAAIAEGQLTLQRVKHGGLEMTDLRTSFRYEKNIVTLNRLVFGLYSGTHEGTLRVDLAGPVPQFQYQGRLSGVDVHELLTRNTTLGRTLYGRLDSTTGVMGRGIDYETITRSLQGNGIYKLKDGRVTTFSLASHIALLSRLAGWDFDTKATELQEADGSFRLEGARIFVEKSRVRTPEALVLADGSIGLDKSLDLQGTAELSDRWRTSGNALGQAIAGIAGSFFRDEKGKVIVPFLLRGTIENPVFAADNAALQAGLARALKPENIQSGVKAIGDLIRQVSGAPTTLATTPPGPAAPSAGAVTSTTLPSKMPDLVEGIGSLVGGILGAVQKAQTGQSGDAAVGVTSPPAILPNVTDLIREIQALANTPLLAEPARQARIRTIVSSLFAVPSPR